MTTRALVDAHRIIPVIVIDDAGAVTGLLDALAEGGIGIAEITLRTEAGLEAIRGAASSPHVVVGAGTVLTPDDVSRVVDAGARFIVSPGLDEDVVGRALELGVGVLPGVATASEVQRAIRLGLDTVKFFPADQLGGLDAILSLAGPFPNVGFVPSGGVTATNAPEYLAHPVIPAVSGSWMAPRGIIARRSFSEIASLCRAAAELA